MKGIRFQRGGVKKKKKKREKEPRWKVWTPSPWVQNTVIRVVLRVTVLLSPPVSTLTRWTRTSRTIWTFPSPSDALHLDTQLSRSAIEPIGAQMANMKTVVALEYLFYDLNKRRVLKMRGGYSIEGTKADLYWQQQHNNDNKSLQIALSTGRRTVQGR